MNVRNLKASDLSDLNRFADASGYPYPDLSSDPHVEAVVVVSDARDVPVMACAAKRLIELYLYVDPESSPSIRMDALRLLHQGMADALRDLGYTECNVQIPPEIAGKFGRRLERSFGWIRNHWPLWGIRF